jgi:hypothetical protein
MEINLLNKIRIREANEVDVNFIFSSWLKSYRLSSFAKQISNAVYFPEQHKLIENLLKSSVVLVACNIEDPDQVYGWVCATKIMSVYCLHYIYIKQQFRKFGIARFLMQTSGHNPDIIGLYTHHTNVMADMAKKANLVYHPYINISYLENCKNGKE